MWRAFLASSLSISCALLALPDDTFTNPEIAQERMCRLLGAFHIYWNAHGMPPGEPHLLFPEYVADPLTFWHPGDSDPPPETIDNSIPNAPNSARISFDWPVALYGACDETLIQDNTIANNSGRFVNMVTNDGVVETDPPLATPIPTQTALAQAHLRRFNQAFHIYANENFEWFPTDLMQLWGSYFRSPRSFWNPGDSDPMPTDITNSELDQQNSTQVSFWYAAAGLRATQVEPDTLLMRDIDASNNGGFGIYVLWGDSRVEFIADCPGDVTGDNSVQWPDLIVLLGNYGVPEHALPEDGDVDGDGDVDQSDLGTLLAHFGEDCLPLETARPAAP